MKSYLRFLSRNKLYTAIEVVGLSVALAFVLIIGSYVWQEYSISHENPDYERIYIPTQPMPYGIFDPMKEQIPEIEEFTLVNSFDDVVMESDDERLVTRGLAVRGDFFDIFDYEFLIGDAGCLESYTDIVISESYALKLAGKPELAMGMRIVPIDDTSQAYTVTGVIKDFDHNYWKYMDFICKGESPLNESAQKNPIFTLSATAFIKVAQAADDTGLQAKIQAVFKQLWGDKMPADRVDQFAGRIGIERFDKQYFSGEFIDDYLNMGDRSQIIILLIVSLLLLVSAVINYINLNLALTNKRAKEMATRSLVGAEKAHIAVKYILESIGFTAICSIAAAGIAVALAPYIGRIIDGQTIAIQFNAASISIYILFVVLIGGICGLIPALNISSIKPISIVNGTYRRKSRAGLNRVFILLQNILAITLIASAIVLDRQMNHMINMPLGADIEDKFILSTDVVETGDIIPVMDEIRQLPFVKKVTLSRGYPTNMNFSTAIQLENSSDLTPVKLLICDTEAFGMWDFEVREDFGTPLAYSVWFSENLYNCFDSREAAEKKAKSWNGNFNRTRIDNFGGVLGNIAGDNAMNETMEQSKVAVIVLPINDFGLYNNTILIETDDNHDEAIEAFDSIYRKFSQEYNGAYIEPWDFGYVEDMMVRVLEEDNQTVKLLMIFALTVFRQNEYMMAYDTGFDKERIAVVEISQKHSQAKAAWLQERLRSLPEVEDVAFSMEGVGFSDTYSTFTLELEGEEVRTASIYCSHNFLDVMGIPVTEGRNFMESDAYKGCAIMNKALKDHGGRIGFTEGLGEIIGQTADVRVNSLRNESAPACYILLPKEYISLCYTYIRLKEGYDRQDITDKIGNILKEMDPAYLFEIQFYDDVMEKLYEPEARQGKIISIFSLLAAALSLIGVFGQVLIDVQQRKRDLAVKKVYGAGTGSIVMDGLKKYTLISSVSFAIAAPTAYFAVSRWLENFVEHAGLSIWTFILTFATILSLTLIIASIQFWLSAVDNPAEALKKE